MSTRLIAAFIALLAVLLALSGCGAIASGGPPSGCAGAGAAPGGEGTPASHNSPCARRRSGGERGELPVVVRDVDGDTLLVRIPGGSERYVRLIGIDTPEDVKPDYPVECGARAASHSMEGLAPEGATVRLVYDGERHDRYGRILAHAYVGGRQLELAQLRRGWAYVYRYDDRVFDGLRRFLATEEAARSRGGGAWGLCDGDFHSAEPGRQD